MTRDEYFEKIAEMWKEHARAADDMIYNGDLFEQGFHAFVANALNQAMLDSTHRDEFAAVLFKVEGADEIG